MLAEVGDEQVIEELDAEPDLPHGPRASASMMAGPVTDTIGHSDERRRDRQGFAVGVAVEAGRKPDRRGEETSAPITSRRTEAGDREVGSAAAVCVETG